LGPLESQTAKALVLRRRCNPPGFKEYLLKMLEKIPGLFSSIIQMLIRLFLIALIFRLNERGYFQPRDAATEVLRKKVWDTVMVLMEYLVENSHNQDFYIVN
jgi:hypothetical protein